MIQINITISFVVKFKSECHGKNMVKKICNMWNKHPNNISFKVAQMSEHHPGTNMALSILILQHM